MQTLPMLLFGYANINFTKNTNILCSIADSTYNFYLTWYVAESPAWLIACLLLMVNTRACSLEPTWFEAIQHDNYIPCCSYVEGWLLLLAVYSMYIMLQSSLHPVVCPWSVACIQVHCMCGVVTGKSVSQDCYTHALKFLQANMYLINTKVRIKLTLWRSPENFWVSPCWESVVWAGP